MNKLSHIILLALFALSSQSCFNYINLNEAQSLGKGNKSVQLEAEGNLVSPDGDDLGGWVSIEGLFTHGLTEKYDVGFFVNSNTALGLHNKYQVLDTDLNDLALGVDFKWIVSSRENWEFIPTLYYTRHIGKAKMLINPAIRYGYSTGSSKKALTPNITIGAQFGERPFRIGYNLSGSQFEEFSAIHSLGLTYNFNW